MSVGTLLIVLYYQALLCVRVGTKGFNLLILEVPVKWVHLLHNREAKGIDERRSRMGDIFLGRWLDQ